MRGKPLSDVSGREGEREMMAVCQKKKKKGVTRAEGKHCMSLLFWFLGSFYSVGCANW